MMPDRLSAEDKKILLKIARQSLTSAANKQIVEPIRLDNMPEDLKKIGATFVTLTLGVAAFPCQMPQSL